MNKQDFPIFKNHPKLVYLDSAATSQKPRIVIDTIQSFYEKENAPLHRVMYPLGEMITQKYESIRKKIADFLHARDETEVVFVKSATEGINLVARSWLEQNLKKNDEIVTTILEHHSNFVPWQQLAKEKKAKLKIAESISGNGTLQKETISSDKQKQFFPINRRTKFVAFTLVSNVTGEILRAEKIIQEIRKKTPRVRILVDASQAVGRMEINFKKLDADFLVFSGHKCYAPTGAGILLVKKDIQKEIRPFLFGGGMILSVLKEYSSWQKFPHFLEAGSPLTEAVVGLGAAIDYIKNIRVKKIRMHELDLISYSLKKFREIPSFHILGPNNPKNRTGVISFYHEKIHAHDIASLLAEENIAARSGHHCAMILHKKLGISATVRISFSLFTEKKDIDRLITVLKKIEKWYQQKKSLP